MVKIGKVMMGLLYANTAATGPCYLSKRTDSIRAIDSVRAATVASRQNYTVVIDSAVKCIIAMEHSFASTAKARAIAMQPVIKAAKVAEWLSERGTGPVAADLRQNYRLGPRFARPL